MNPQELLRRIGQNIPHQQETDWAGRVIPDRIQIEDALRGRHLLPPSKRELRRIEKMEKRLGGSIERG